MAPRAEHPLMVTPFAIQELVDLQAQLRALPLTVAELLAVLRGYPKTIVCLARDSKGA